MLAEELAARVRVGCPLSTLRAEAAGLLQLRIRLSENQPALLLVFMDSLVLLDILRSGGRQASIPGLMISSISMSSSGFFPLLTVLRQWPQVPVRLVKVKSHT